MNTLTLTLTQQRKVFEKELFAAVTPLLKRTGWKKSRCALFTQSGDYYQDIFVSLHRNSNITSAELRFKPMNLDPILWDILGMRENQNEPLSFRTWGAFTCSGLPMLSIQVEKLGDSPEHVAAALLELINSKASLLEGSLASATYSELVAKHPNHVARGAYAVTLVASLINEQNYDLARRVANSYAKGEHHSCANLSKGGISFHELAVQWLDDRRCFVGRG